MSITERKTRERAERERRIVEAARSIAEAEGWPAVTIRRLATEIEYSQPVLYSHFANRDAIVTAVAVAGFRSMAEALRSAASSAPDRKAAATNAALAYLAFASDHPSLYEAMFTLPTNLRFAEAQTPPALHEAFAALSQVLALLADDRDVRTETFWAALHGLAELERSGRIRAHARAERVMLLVRGLVGATPSDG